MRLKKEIDETLDMYIRKKSIEISPEKRNAATQVMYKTLSFCSSMQWYEVENVHRVQTPKELLEIYTLRSKIYTNLGYNHEFPDAIHGLNFDHFDEHSLILFTKVDNKISGTCRVIFDTQSKLPLDKNYSLDYLRQNNYSLAEVSRLIIATDNKGLNMEFKFLTTGVYSAMIANDSYKLLSVIRKEHFSLYEKFGGFHIEASLQSYGALNNEFVVTVWELAKISRFFKKVFLNGANNHLASKGRDGLDKLAS